MPAPGTHPGLPRRMDAPNGAPVRHDAAPPLRRFLRETRAAVGLVAAFLSLMVIGGAVLIGDHLWMIGKRDLLKSAADAAVIAATLEMRRRPDSESDEDMGKALQSVAERYARFNVLENTGGKVEPEDVVVTVDIDRAADTVGVSVKADAVDTLFAKRLFKDKGFKEPGEVTAKAGTERDATKTEVVLAIDISASMNRNLAGGFTSGSEPSRMTIVQKAARTLVDILSPEDGKSVAAIGVVPWHLNVRLDETMRATWERKGWAVYPESKTYRWPYLAVPAPPPETWRMQPKPEAWMGCLDQRSLDGSSPPGLSAELPTDTPLHDGLLSQAAEGHQLPVPRSLRRQLHGQLPADLLSRADVPGDGNPMPGQVVHAVPGPAAEHVYGRAGIDPAADPRHGQGAQRHRRPDAGRRVYVLDDESDLGETAAHPPSGGPCGVARSIRRTRRRKRACARRSCC